MNLIQVKSLEDLGFYPIYCLHCFYFDSSYPVILFGRGPICYKSYLIEKIDILHDFPSRRNISVIQSNCTHNRVIVAAHDSIVLYNLIIIEKCLHSELILELKENERVIAAQFIGDDAFALGFSTNYVSVHNAHDGKAIYKLNSLSNSFSMSMKFYYENDKMWVYSGTIDRQIHAWSFLHHLDGCTPLHESFILSGHVGSIFSVKRSLHHPLLASTSDDRSIRVWDLETRQQILICEGHKERTRDVCFLELIHSCPYCMNSSEISSTFIVSVGEDCFLKIWHLSCGRELSSTQAHCHKDIWAVDCIQSQGKWIIVTAGNDKSLKMWDVEDMLSYLSSVNHCQVGLLRDATADDECNSMSMKIDCDAGICKIVCSTTRCRVILMKRSLNDNLLTVDCILETESKISRISVNWDLNVGMICHSNGLLSLFKLSSSSIETMSSWNKSTAKSLEAWVMQFCFQCSCYWIVTVSSDNNSYLWCMSSLPDRCEILKCSKLCLESNSPACACAISNSVICPTCSMDGYLFLGDRLGNFSIFQISRQLLNDLTPVQTFHQLHRKASISSITCRNSTVLTAGYDGMINILSKSASSFRYNVIQSISTSPITTPELISFKSTSIIVCGYHSQVFSVIDLTSATELFHTNAKSWRRAHAIDVSHCLDGSLFGFCFSSHNDDGDDIKYMLKTYLVKDHASRINNLFSRSFHGRCVTCAQLCFAGFDGDYCLLSGSEDTSVRLSTLSKLRHARPVCLHNSGVRCMCSCPYNDGMLLVTGSGQMELFINFIDKDRVMEANRNDYDLSCPVVQLLHRYIVQDAVVDHRIMVMSIIPCFHGHLLITSDSNCDVRFSILKGRDDELGLMMNDAFLLKFEFGLPLSMKLIHIGSEAEFDNYLLFVGSSLGTITILSATLDCLAPSIINVVDKMRYQGHVTGVNALDYQLNSDVLLLVSGGDDGCLTVASIGLKDWILIKLVHVRRFFMSAIQSVHIIGSVLIAVSSDRLVNFFSMPQLKLETSGDDNIQLCCQKVTAIGDVQGSCVTLVENKAFLCVYGEGIAYFDFLVD